MAKCEICGGKMRKWSDAFNTHYTCQNCGNDDFMSKAFKIPKSKGGKSK